MFRYTRFLVSFALVSALLLTSCGGGDHDDAGSSDTGEPGSESTGLSEEEVAEQERAEAEAARAEAVQEQEQALAGPGEDHREFAAELVAEMSVAERAGQVIIGEYQGTDVDSAVALIEEHHLAGVILMGHNIPGGENSVDVEALAEQISVLSGAGGEGRAVPPIISVDQEGGLVTRVGSPMTEWPTPMALGAVHHGSDGLFSSGQVHRLMAADLAELGFTVTFAPNADVTIGSSDPTMGSRTFGSDPETVGSLAIQGLRGLADAGVAGSAKHFPGHGSVTEDSHHSLPIQQATLEELRERDWLPFAEVIQAGAPMVMMGHLEVPALEAGVPSSLSPAAYAEIREMGHDGVIVTDALNMAAIAHHYGGDQAVVTALDAGADLILMPASAPGAHAAIIAAVESGDLEETRLNEAAERVVALVLWQQALSAGELAAGPGAETPEELAGRMIYGPVELDSDSHPDDTAQGEDAQEREADSGPLEELTAPELAEQVAAQAVTLVEGQCQAELVTEAIQIQGGTQQDRDRLAAAAQQAGLQTGWGPVITLLGGTTPSTGDVVVSLDRPEGLADSSAETKIGLYGRTPESFAALVEVLTGAEAPGALPVEVGSFPAGHSAC
ncbi:glycoside hydrolase family 3 protein [Nesterenkonia ebinurensis]|uniref:glycoside hydrolase family 3 protein n=1 Tax=Nesterenkonia ebinurensis TaxID=2608252 RepID=UPI001CC5EAC5|nr:glycoside hydrolase family 3 N-terminal domain-containing protein [Nesterenkonia ebinurensis]